MGINGFWEVVGDGDVVALAALATEHFQCTGKALRIAIDEAAWRFNNLNEFQVAKIRESEPAANPVEKAILYRVLKLLRLNIRPIFIFDGKSRPWKNGRPAGRIGWEKISLLVKVLDHLKVPHHHAPGEAEAECARLETLGVVDAVWSDDSDIFMFGANTVIQHYRDKTKNKSANVKSDSHIHVYKASKIKDQFGIDKRGWILFALLSGGDYDKKGLRGCGPKAALEAAIWQDGRLVHVLDSMDCTDIKRLGRALPIFTYELKAYFEYHAKQYITVPDDFPKALAVKNYCSPKVSTAQQAIDLRALQGGWDHQIDESRLRVFLRQKFQFRTKEYIRHIVPVLLTQHLTRAGSADVEYNKALQLRLIHKRGKAADDYDLERLLAFNPLACSNLNLKIQPADEDWRIWTDKKTGAPWDPSEHIEIELLDCLLVHGLGEAELERLKHEASKPKSRKRKVQTDTESSDRDGGSLASVNEANTPEIPDINASAEPSSTSGLSAPRKRRKSPTNKGDPSTDLTHSTSSKEPRDYQPMANKMSSLEPKKAVPSPPHEPIRFRLPTAMQMLTGAEREKLSQKSDHDQPGSQRLTYASSVNIKHESISEHQPLIDTSVTPPDPAAGRPTPQPAIPRVHNGAHTPLIKIENDESVQASSHLKDTSDAHVTDLSLSIEERYFFHERRIREHMDTLEAEFRLHDVDQQVDDDRMISERLKTSRRFVQEKLLTEPTFLVISDIHERFAPENARIVSAHAQQLRKETYDQANRLLKIAQRGLLQLGEAFAECCARKKVVLADRGKRPSLSEGVAPLENPTKQDDLGMMARVINFQCEIDRALPLKYDFTPGPEPPEHVHFSDRPCPLAYADTPDKDFVLTQSLDPNKIKGDDGARNANIQRAKYNQGNEPAPLERSVQGKQPTSDRKMLPDPVAIKPRLSGLPSATSALRPSGDPAIATSTGRSYLYQAKVKVSASGVNDEYAELQKAIQMSLQSSLSLPDTVAGSSRSNAGSSDRSPNVRHASAVSVDDRVAHRVSGRSTSANYNARPQNPAVNATSVTNASSGLDSLPTREQIAAARRRHFQVFEEKYSGTATSEWPSVATNSSKSVLPGDNTPSANESRTARKNLSSEFDNKDRHDAGKEIRKGKGKEKETREAAAPRRINIIDLTND